MTGLLAAVLAAAAVLGGGGWLAARRRRRRFASLGDAHAAREAALWEFIERSLEAWSLEAVVLEVAEVLARGLGMPRVAILEPGDDGWTARPPGQEATLPTPRAQNVFGWFRHNPDPVLLSDLGDGRYGGMRLTLEELCQLYGAEALLPLQDQQRLLGVVAAGGLGRPLRPDERDFLARLHLEAAAAAANVRLYHEAALKLSLEHEVDAARTVQHGLLPRQRCERLGAVTVAARHRATEGGGSLYAAFEHEGRVTLVLGDTTARGVAASMITAVAKACCEAIPDADVETLLAALNRAIYRPGPRRPQMRCLAAVLNPAAGTVQVAGAGAPFPYCVVGSDGPPEVSCLVARGPVLGDLPEARFRAVTAPVRPGDLLVLFTPGLVAAESADGMPYGDRRLQRTLLGAAARSPEPLLEELAADLEQFTAGGPGREDSLLVVAQTEG